VIAIYATAIRGWTRFEMQWKELKQKHAKEARALLERALRKTKHARAKAAQLLGVPPSTLTDLIRKYDVNSPSPGPGRKKNNA